MLISVEGTIDSIRFYNPDNGYTVFTLDVRGDPITIVGNFPELKEGQPVRVVGEKVFHPKFGEQIKTTSFDWIMPHTAWDIQEYLGSGIIKGVGLSIAATMVRKFGDKTLEILDTEPDRLLGVPGIGPAKLAGIKESWIEQKSIQELMMLTSSLGISYSLALKIHKKYGGRAIDQLKSDHYQLAIDIRGVGFLTADKLARSLGIITWYLCCCSNISPCW